jgi:hypothetical protein
MPNKSKIGDQPSKLEVSTQESTRALTPPERISTDPLLDAPRWFAGYHLERVLGRGGMGVVYKARHAQLDLTVALKMMRAGAESPEITERFLREARAVARLNHSNIVRLFEAGQADGCHYFTMAYVEGGTLRERQLALAGSPRDVAALMQKVANGVHHAHQHDVIHRDLKPGNILVDKDGEPLVSDFGLVKFLDATDDLTVTGGVLGTAPYMSPEQMAGKKEIGPASDVWSLGVILYELLVGRRPFLGEKSLELANEVLQSEPPRPRSLNKNLDRALETIVMKCLEKSPEQRYASAQALADDLGCWLHGEPISARPLAWPLRVARRVKRQPVVYALTLVAAVTLAVLTTLWWTAAEPTAFDPPQAAPVGEDRGAVIREWQSQLKHGRAVELIGKQGSPRAHWWSKGSGFAKVGQDSVWELDSREVALLELLPDVPCDHFRLQAELRQNEGDIHGALGLYVGGEMLPPRRGEYYFLNASFADLGEFAGKGQIQLYTLSSTLGVGPGTFDWLHDKEKEWTFPAQPPGKGSNWRLLALDVHRDKIAVRFEQVAEGSVKRKDLTMGARLLLKTRNLPAKELPTFGPRLACGVFVRAANVSVRNVTITPLNP